MQVPIAHALRRRHPISARRLSGCHWTSAAVTQRARRLQFFDVEPQRFPALGRLCGAAARAGACLALNAANEVAVAAFLSGELRYTDIVPVVADSMARADLTNPGDINEVFARDVGVRAIAGDLVAARRTA